MRTGGYPDDWDARRKSVLKRDGYECQECGAADTTLQVHHITPISEGGGHGLDNLTTICQSCHAKEHPTKVKLNTAIREQRRVRMKYSSSSGTRVRELDPYGLAMHEGIQYLVGYDYYRNEKRTFRPKRIQWLELTDQTFSKPNNWDTSQYLAADMGYQRGGRHSKRTTDRSIDIGKTGWQLIFGGVIFASVVVGINIGIIELIELMGAAGDSLETVRLLLSVGIAGYLGVRGSRYAVANTQ